MVRNQFRNTMVVVAVLLLPLVLMLPAASAGHEDQCAGGIDASDTYKDPTPLEVLAGCSGRFHNGPGNSANHEDDTQDTYSLRHEGTATTAHLDWQFCNNSDGYMMFEVYYKPDPLTTKQVAVGSMSPHTCSSDVPKTLNGGPRPGTWVFAVWTVIDYMGENESMQYWFYAQPLYR